MSIINKSRDFMKSKIDDIKTYENFKKMDGCIAIKVMKNNRPKEYCIRNDSEKSLRFFKPVKSINRTDWIVDERNNKYFVSNVHIDQKFLVKVDGEEKECKTVVIDYCDCKDNESLIDEYRQDFNTTNSVNVTINNSTNSSYNNLVSITNYLEQKNITSTWNKLSHDLNYRFDYSKYDKLTSNVKESIHSRNYNTIDEKNYNHIANTIGGILGSFLGAFLVQLKDYCDK